MFWPEGTGIRAIILIWAKLGREQKGRPECRCHQTAVEVSFSLRALILCSTIICTQPPALFRKPFTSSTRQMVEWHGDQECSMSQCAASWDLPELLRGNEAQQTQHRVLSRGKGDPPARGS